MRIASACLQCRTTKRRCTIDSGQDKCAHCTRRRIKCSLQRNDDLANTGNVRPAQVPAVHGRGGLVFSEFGEAGIYRMVTAYLTLVHGRPHSLFHVPTLWKDISEREIQPALLLSICAMGAHLDDELRRLAPLLTSRAKQAMHSEVENICLSSIQTCILLANICAAELQPNVETLYFGMATRMAQIVGLHRAAPDQGPLQTEINSRIWYSLVIADNFCSPGIGIPRIGLSGSVALPCDEKWFQDVASDDSSASRPSKAGLWTHVVQLVEVLASIHDLNRRLAEDGMEDIEAESDVKTLAARLEHWRSVLPEDVIENDSNFEAHRSRGTGGAFVALHLGYHHYSTLLYFRYLDSASFTGPKYGSFASRCRHHASAFSALLKKSRETSGCEAVYATVGHMALVSSSVILHTLLFGSSGEVATARADLVSNFAALLHLKKLWPCLERTMGRLLQFQEACLQNERDSTHQIDRWMIRFLVEHALPLDDRTKYQEPEWPASSPDSQITEFRYRERMVNQALSTLWDRPS